MKSWLVYSFVFIFWSCLSHADVQNYCSTEQTALDASTTYKFNLPIGYCTDIENCWIQFKAPEDAFELKLDGQSKVKLDTPKTYVSNEYFLLPFTPNATNLEIKASDTNQNINFPKKFCANFGNYQELHWINAIQWFFSTGSNLFSAYFLLIVSVFLVFSFWFWKSSLGFSLFTYSIVSILYLVSFSEYPRTIFDPVLMTGGIHFPLRLLQDLCLVLVFYNFHQQYDSFSIIKKLSWLYGIVISIYLLLLVVGVKDYVYYNRIIIIMAPLVAAPMALGTWFAFKLKDPIERKALIPISVLLLLFQINDLLAFWKITHSYFTVRLYIPFIIGMALFLYFRRVHAQVLKTKTDSEKNKVFKEFLHDVKSPLAVLRIFLSGKEGTYERHKIIQTALDRIESMVLQVDSSKGDDRLVKVPLKIALETIIAQKGIELPALKISLDSNEEVFTFAEPVKLQRIFSNIINNAYESYGSEKTKELKISLIQDQEEVEIRFKDNGKGISKNILAKIHLGATTNKRDGNGIGLSSAQNYLTNTSGKLNVISKEGSGTTIEIKLKVVQTPVWYLEMTSNHSPKLSFSSKTDLESKWNIIHPESIIELNESCDIANFIECFNKHPFSFKVYLTGQFIFQSKVSDFFDEFENVIWVNKFANVQERTQNSPLDFVLIDDDKYIRLSWEYFAKTSKKNIKTFSDVESFIKASETFPKNSPIYLDLNINGQKSTLHLDRINALGFTNIILATGEDIDVNSLPKHVTGISGKLPPLQ